MLMSVQVELLVNNYVLTLMVVSSVVVDLGIHLILMAGDVMVSKTLLTCNSMCI